MRSLFFAVCFVSSIGVARAGPLAQATPEARDTAAAASRTFAITYRQLVPEQAGPPLNYFVDPYAEADDRPVRATKTWSFADLD